MGSKLSFFDLSAGDVLTGKVIVSLTMLVLHVSSEGIEILDEKGRIILWSGDLMPKEVTTWWTIT